MSKLSTDPYKGVRDFYPEEMCALKWMFGIIRKEVEKYGYVEYGASPLEPAELYQAKTGEEIVNEQTYTFTDRGDRLVTLRPEMTPTVARMVAARRRDLGFPLRWYSIPNLFRYENPQKGRLREHYQLNVDLFGTNDLSGDIEIITLASNILKAFGAGEKDFTIKINSRLLLEELFDSFEIAKEVRQPLSKLIDRKEKIDKGVFEKGVHDLLGETAKELLNVLEVNQRISDRLQGKSAGLLRMLQIIEALEKQGITNVVFTPTLMRGFDYYTDIIFEVFDNDKENPRSLFGGGRYDNLTELFGGDKVPAVGFGMGDVTLENFLSSRNLIPPYTPETHIAIGYTDENIIDTTNKIVNDLRNKGVNVSLYGLTKQAGDFYKYAEKNKIPFVLLVDNASGEYLVKESLKGGKEKMCTNSKEIQEFLSSSR